jgi:GTP-binding protein
MHSTVVLAGRPNVGKSTLFNRLLHKRRSITDPTPGVTRDPVAAEAFIAGHPVRLIDTGGFKLDRDKGENDFLDDLVVEKALETIKKADIIILLFEAGSVTAEDEEFITLMRPYQDKIIAVVNKTEGGRLTAESYNLLSYGFSDVIMISAEHGDNISQLEAAIGERISSRKVAKSPSSNFSSPLAGEVGWGGDSHIRIALLGKPNTGKSSLSNLLTNSDASIVSPVPGTTRDVVEGSFSYKGRDFQILDTAGIRRKAKVNEALEYYSVNRAIKTIDEADIVILLIDAVEGLSEQDKKIAALACDKGRGIIFALNKWDLMPHNEDGTPMKNALNATLDRIHFVFPQMEYAPIVPISAKDNTGIPKLLNTVVSVNGQLQKTFETAPLNSALAQWLEEHPTPHGPQTRFKLKYIVQASANPQHFILFASRIQAVKEPYIAYIRNKMRKDLGLTNVPIELEVRSSRENKPRTTRTVKNRS